MEIDFHSVYDGHGTAPFDPTLDTRETGQARVLMQCIYGFPTAFRDVKELRVCRKNLSWDNALTEQAQTPQHMALASMAVAFQSLEVCTHMYTAMLYE